MATIVHPLVTAPMAAPGQANPLYQADTGTVLCAGQTGTGDSTNILDRGGITGPAILAITSTVGATPTVTVNMQCSSDGQVWRNVPYALVATPSTTTVAALTITTAVTTNYLLTGSWRFLKLALSANTNVTLSAVAYLYPGAAPIAL